MINNICKPRNDDEEVCTKDPIVISFENLSVFFPESKDMFYPLKWFCQQYLCMGFDMPSSFYALNGLSGFVSEGETCLVLGPCLSGKSTLLLALCGRLSKECELKGGIFLNGVPLQTDNQRWRKISNYVSPIDNEHSPFLTVSETLYFAAKCTCDEKVSSEEIEKRVQAMLELLGIVDVRDVVIGDENLRGISGGEKRRVTVGEMLINEKSKLFCLDNITDGLSSTDSLHLIKKITNVCKKNRKAAVITLLQPSEEIINEFDKLLILSEKGGMAYFGPINKRQLDTFFHRNDSSLSLNESVTESDGTLVTGNGFSNASCDHDVLDRVKAFRVNAQSIPNRGIEDILPEENNDSSYFYQFKVIANRKRKLIFRNPITYIRPLIGIFFGIVIGSIFSVIHQDIIGAITRSGYLYLMNSIVLMLSNGVTSPYLFAERASILKFRSAEFFSGPVYYITNIILDMPLSIIEPILLSSISYYWVDMNKGANHFLFFLLVLIGIENVGQALARFGCSFFRNLQANVIFSLVYGFISFIFAGFMPTYDNIPNYFRWMSWLSPIAYAFEAEMINEFYNRTMYGIVYTDTDDEEIDIGEISGYELLKNLSLPRVDYGSMSQIKNFDLFMIFCFAFFYDVLGMIFNEYNRHKFHNQIRRSQVKIRCVESEVVETISLEGSQSEPLLEENLTENVDLSSNADTTVPKTVTVVDLNYKVYPENRFRLALGPLLDSSITRKLFGKCIIEEEITLLHNVTAQFKYGKMTALVGDSGTGKSTLMDVIAGYTSGGKISGSILIDYAPKKDSVWKKITGYAEQNDVFNPYLSVLETLQFTATCRLSQGAHKESIISNVVRLMGLGPYTNMLVGKGGMDGLTKPMRKRLNIANQLVAQPKILFLDEPTTSLDSISAINLIEAIRRSTEALQLITLASIHQPSRQIFESFDDFLLLTKGGRVAYMGPIGLNSENIMNYFHKLSNEEDFPSSSCNPADYALRIIDKYEPHEVTSFFFSSPIYSKLNSEIELNMDSASLTPLISLLSIDYTNNKFLCLIKRHFICSWRNSEDALLRLLFLTAGSSFIGLMFLQIDQDLSGAINAIGAISFLVFFIALEISTAIVPNIEDRAVLYRESVSGCYSKSLYLICQLCVDLPFNLLKTLLTFLPFYYLVNLREGSEFAGYFFLTLFLSCWLTRSIGQLYSYVSPNTEVASGLSGLTIILSVVLMGFYVTRRQMSDNWIWANNSNIFRYMLQGFCINELSGQSYYLDIVMPQPPTKPPHTLPPFTVPPYPYSQPEPNNQSLQISSLHALPSSSDTGSSLILFEPGVVSIGNNVTVQPLSLTFNSKSTEHNYTSFSELSKLVDCMIDNNCLVDPISPNFILCNVIHNPPRSAPCAGIFSKLMPNSKAVTGCLGSLNDSVQTRTLDSSIDISTMFSDSDHRDVVKCLLKELLPSGNILYFLNTFSKVIEEIYDMKITTFNSFGSKIYIPGDLILFYFGWSYFSKNDKEFHAPYKWHYCITVIFSFIVSIELLKIFVVRFIVWTKR